MKTIGIDAFNGCSALKSVTLEEGIAEIESGAFENSNVEELHLPSTITNIGYGAFENCSKLKSITIPGSLKTTEMVVDFRECLRNHPIISDTLSDSAIDMLGSGTFDGCDSLSLITIKGKEEDLQNMLDLKRKLVAQDEKLASKIKFEVI